MAYGSASLRASRTLDEDAVSMLSAHARPSQYQAYLPDNNRRRSSEVSLANSATWTISPINLQQSLPPIPPIPPTNEPGTTVGPSIFGSRAVLGGPYQEQVAWENSTEFRRSRAETPNPVPEIRVATVTGRHSSRSPRRYFRHPRHLLEPWTPGFWARFPWWGFGALFAALLFSGVSAGILLASDGRTPKSWKLGKDNTQPQVYVSILETGINFLILFALVDGIAIKLWRQLLHGTTLSKIYDTYEGCFLWPAIVRLFKFRFSLVATACLLATLSSIRGPLFQRSLTISENEHIGTSGTMDLKMAPFPLVEYFQNNESDPRRKAGISTAFANVLQRLSSNESVPYNQSSANCGEYCTSKVKGFGFKFNCTSNTIPYDLSSFPEICKSCPIKPCQVHCDYLRANAFNPTFFSVGFQTNANTTGDPKAQALTIQSVYKSDTSCKGQVQVRTCSLFHAMTDHDITITNGTIQRRARNINSTYYEDITPPDIRAQLMANYWPAAFSALFPPVSVNVTPNDDFSGLQYRKCVAPSRNSVQQDGIANLTSCSDGTELQPVLLGNDASMIYATPSQAPESNDTLCSLTWRDPMDDMIAKMQSLAFRITTDMANTDPSIFAPTYTGEALTKLQNSWVQPISVSGYRTQTVYRTNTSLVAVGIVLSFVAVVAILPLYMGFWEFGRDVSLNPLEIARAFGSPLMDGMDGNATPEHIVIERGEMKVRYGAVERYGEERKLRVEESTRATVRTPWRGEIFG